LTRVPANTCGEFGQKVVKGLELISRSLLIAVLIVALAIPSGVAFGADLEVPITGGMTWEVGQTLHFAPMPRFVSNVSLVLERNSPTQQLGSVTVTVSIRDVGGNVRSESNIEELVINHQQTIEGGRIVALDQIGTLAHGTVFYRQDGTPLAPQAASREPHPGRRRQEQ